MSPWGCLFAGKFHPAVLGGGSSPQVPPVVWSQGFAGWSWDLELFALFLLWLRDGNHTLSLRKPQRSCQSWTCWLWTELFFFFKNAVSLAGCEDGFAAGFEPMGSKFQGIWGAALLWINPLLCGHCLSLQPFFRSWQQGTGWSFLPLKILLFYPFCYHYQLPT